MASAIAICTRRKHKVARSMCRSRMPAVKSGWTQYSAECPDAVGGAANLPRCGAKQSFGRGVHLDRAARIDTGYPAALPSRGRVRRQRDRRTVSLLAPEARVLILVMDYLCGDMLLVDNGKDCNNIASSDSGRGTKWCNNAGRPSTSNGIYAGVKRLAAKHSASPPT